MVPVNTQVDLCSLGEYIFILKSILVSFPTLSFLMCNNIFRLGDLDTNRTHHWLPYMFRFATN